MQNTWPAHTVTVAAKFGDVPVPGVDENKKRVSSGPLNSSGCLLNSKPATVQKQNQEGINRIWFHASKTVYFQKLRSDRKDQFRSGAAAATPRLLTANKKNTEMRRRRIPLLWCIKGSSCCSPPG